MESLKYSLIKNQKQYDLYCEELEELVLLKKKPTRIKDEIELLTLLIATYNEKLMTDYEISYGPVEILSDLIKENQFSQIELASRLAVSPQLINDILKYRREITKKMALKIGEVFKMKHTAFLQPYKLRKAS